MGYWKQFDNFDPLTGQVPYWPFSQSSGIVWRARNLLRARTSDQIMHLASFSDQIVSEYFSQAKTDEIERLKNEGQWEFFDSDEDGNILEINENRLSECDFPNPDNTSDIDALTECIDGWTDVFGDGSPEPEPFEYFATMALWKVADAIERVTYVYDIKTRTYSKKDRKKLESYDYTSAAGSLVEAMEAICHAESLRDIEHREKRFSEQLQIAEKQTSAKVLKANEEKWKALQEQENKQKSDHAKRMAELSKANRNKSMAAVLLSWDGDAAMQKLSIAKAGIRLSSWLATQDLEFFEPRTVSLWISAHKKNKLPA
jgi:hypothetical protein